MKTFKHFFFAAMLSCGTGLFTACTAESDNPVAPIDDEALINRKELISHLEKNARILADNVSMEPFSVTAQAYEQLLALIQRDKNFVTNMKTVFTALSNNRLFASPVAAGSELEKMGYLAYVTVDNGGFAFQVLFDGKGGSRIRPSDHLEFIFPATIDGIGTTLFKLIIENSADCYQTVTASNFNNMKRLACVNRLPKSFTMTLNGLINNQELTLGKSIVNLELPLSEGSQYVSLDASSFKLHGSHSSYLSAGDEHVIDYSLSMEDEDMALSYSFNHNGLGIISCDAQMVLPEKESFISQMSKNGFNVDNLKTFAISILDDLMLSGTVSDGASFVKYFGLSAQDQQPDSAADVLSTAVESLNNSCTLQLSCEHLTKPETMKFCLVQKDGKYRIVPALKDLDGDGLVPLGDLLGKQAMEPLMQLFAPASNASSSTIKFYSVFMQMMPMNR